jgi:hypothetical protein
MNTTPQLLFILGFPRSGTKLLMQLLKTHPEVSGLDYEINLAHHIALGNIKDSKDLKNYFFENTISLNLKSNDKQLKFFERNHEGKSISDLYIDFLDCFNQSTNTKYLLDKSPRYLPHIQELVKMYPEAKFIHLVRNPIDVALSHKKVWNKSLIRTSSQWNMSNSIFLGVQNERIIRVKYEDLTISPEKVLSGLAEFLRIDNVFDYQNVNSKESHGKIRDPGIKKNLNKELLPEYKVKIIEEYAYSAMKAFNYKVNYANKEKKRNIMMKAFLLFWDHINLIWFHVNEKGLAKGILYYKKLL